MNHWAFAFVSTILLGACSGMPKRQTESFPSYPPRPGALTVRELLELPSVVNPQLSPDGKSVAFLVTEPTLEPGQASRVSLWLVDSAGTSAPRILGNAPARPSSLGWAPNGGAILCVSGQSGSPQAWLVPVDGSDPKQITKEEGGVTDPILSPDGKWIAFAADVPRRKPQPNDLSAKVIDELLFRHWVEWRDNLRTHTFVQNLDSGAVRRLSDPRFDAPGFSLAGPTPYAFSSDSKTLYYTQGAEKDEALSTDFNLYAAAVDGSTPPRRLTSNLAWDGSPAPSPDGRYVAFRSQATPGFESDLFTLQLLEVSSGKIRRIADDLDRWVDEAVWAPDSKTLYVGTEDEGTRAVWRVPAEGGPSTKLYNANFSGFQVSPDGSFLVGRLASLRAPGEIARLSSGKPALTLLTRIGASWLHGKTLGEAESVWIDGAKGPAGAKGGQIQGWLVKPPGFEKGKKYPFLLMVHGGPQQAWLDAFGGSMWNPQIFAAHGYVVLALNPHGSTGFGQAFTNQISGDWGGAVHEDCMRACDWAVAEGFADPNRMGALGGSFGGYMVNWFLGHTDRFKALVSHAGVYNLESMWGVTEELWFPEWDLKGRPWDSAQYQDRSPHKFAKNFKTPTLVTHGELDYRVPIGEGIQLFQTLVRLGVPARFLYYPDEGHWLLKARNRELWLRTVLEWFDTYVKNAK